MSRFRRLAIDKLQPFLLELPPPRQLELETNARPFDWKQVFGNDHPVEVEVGFGKGLFLLNAAQARLDINFLGIEIERKYQLYAANRLAKRSIGNVRLTCGDARVVFRNYLADQSVTAIHVYFPDPWWKNRHRKRRLFTEEFLAQCVRVLCPGGKLHVATDVEGYFRTIVACIERRVDMRAMSQAASPPSGDYLTNFERKYRLENRPIYRAVYEK
jgi:tRNA (guanine-N7-)-methyltransferase